MRTAVQSFESVIEHVLETGLAWTLKELVVDLLRNII